MVWIVSALVVHWTEAIMRNTNTEIPSQQHIMKRRTDLCAGTVLDLICSEVSGTGVKSSISKVGMVRMVFISPCSLEYAVVTNSAGVRGDGAVRVLLVFLHSTVMRMRMREERMTM